jgi:biotin carboxylase
MSALKTDQSLKRNAVFILVESNTSGTGRLFANTVAELGYLPLVLTDDPSRYPYLRSDGIDYLEVRTSDFKALENCVLKVVGREKIAGVYSSSEYYIEAAARIAELLRLPGESHAIVAGCRNKHTQRESLRRAEVFVPKFRRAQSHEEAMSALDEIPLPVIVKPTFGTGSVGVRLCRSVEEVVSHATTLLNQGFNERGLPAPKEILIEEYLAGPEYSVEVFGTHVLGITAKHLSEEPMFVEAGHDFPAMLSADLAASIRETALRSLQAVGLSWGPAHIEMRVVEGHPAIIEINPRLAGGFIPELVRNAHGIDLIRETLKHAIGLRPNLKPASNGYAAIRFVTNSGQGNITRVEGLESAGGMPGIVDVKLYKNVGDMIQVRGDFRDRIGHVIASGNAFDQAVQTVEAAHARIRVHTGGTCEKFVREETGK